jgi:hypothetical protein
MRALAGSAQPTASLVEGKQREREEGMVLTWIRITHAHTMLPKLWPIKCTPPGMHLCAASMSAMLETVVVVVVVVVVLIKADRERERGSKRERQKGREA